MLKQLVKYFLIIFLSIIFLYNIIINYSDFIFELYSTYKPFNGNGEHGEANTNVELISEIALNKDTKRYYESNIKIFDANIFGYVSLESIDQTQMFYYNGYMCVWKKPFEVYKIFCLVMVINYISCLFPLTQDWALVMVESLCIYMNFDLFEFLTNKVIITVYPIECYDILSNAVLDNSKIEMFFKNNPELQERFIKELLYYKFTNGIQEDDLENVIKLVDHAVDLKEYYYYREIALRR